MRIVLAIDPGPTHCGVVRYDGTRVLDACKREHITNVLVPIGRDYEDYRIDHVAIERVQSYGIAGGTLLQTSEVVGRIWQRATDFGIPVSLHYRREVLRFLDVTGKGNRDSLVRHRLIEMFAQGDAKKAKGTKKEPGPLYGVSGHAWAALAVAVTAWDELERRDEV